VVVGELEKATGVVRGGSPDLEPLQNVPDVDLELIQFCQKLTENFHGMLLSEEHASSVILRSMIATMAVVKGERDDAEALLQDAMMAFEAWEKRRSALWNDAVVADQAMLEIMAKRSNIQDKDMDLYRERLEKLKNKIQLSSGDDGGG